MDDSWKSYIHTPKPQIQSVELRKGRLGIRTIPCFLVKREESRNFDVCFGCFLVFGREKNKCVERLGKMRISRKKKCPPRCVFRGGGPWPQRART